MEGCLSCWFCGGWFGGWWDGLEGKWGKKFDCGGVEWDVLVGVVRVFAGGGMAGEAGMDG